MRPKLLKIYGLNSFVEEEVIDFSSLIEKGLFGIFGPTGSGKSSILDALTLALYGRISRDTKEFINKETEELYVYFEFVLGDNTYTVERKLQISKSGGYKTSLARLVIGDSEEIYDGVQEINEKIEGIIGLNHEDFMRTVVLPQGKFSRFLKLTGRDRRDMLERILGLEEFGEELMSRLKDHRQDREDRIKDINGVLKKYEGISGETLQQKQEELSQLKSIYKDVSSSLQEKREEFEEYKYIRKLQTELEDYQKQQQELAKRAKNIGEIRQKLSRTKKAVSIKKDLERFAGNQKQLEQTRRQLEELNKEIEKLSRELKQLEQEHDNLVQQKEEKLPELTEKKVQIKSALRIQEKNDKLTQKIKDKQSEIIDREDKQKEITSKLQGIKETIEQKQTQLKNRQEAIEELEVSSEYRKTITEGLRLENEFEQARKQLESLQQDRQALEKHIKQESDKLDKLLEQLKRVEAKVLHYYNQKLSQKQARREQFGELLEKQKQQLQTAEKRLEETKSELEELRQRNIAGVLARSLEEGAACPVCGSREHPDLAGEVEVDLTSRNERREQLEEDVQKLKQKINQTSSQLDVNENNINRLKKEKRGHLEAFSYEISDLQGMEVSDVPSLEALKADREKIRGELNQLKGSLKRNRDNLEQLEGKLEKHEAEFKELKQQYTDKLQQLDIEESFAAENESVSKKDDRLEEIRHRVKALQEELEEKTERRDELKETLAEREKLLIQDKHELKGLQSNFEDNKQEITDMIGDRDPRKYLQQVVEREQELKQQVKQKKERREQTENRLNKRVNKKSAISDRLKRLKEETGQLESYLNNKIEEFEFEGIEEARNYLKWEDSIDDWKQEIRDYEEEKKKIDNNLRRLKEELDGESITGKQWQQLKQEKSKLEARQGQLQEKVGGLKARLEQLQEDLEDKQQKQEIKEELEHELALIGEINDLVRGKNFVEFVAIRQLKYIAREASKRLMEITNNRYRLELNEQGEFIICDLYNGGVKRDCNTLSGGETFLTSLSLALALSSQIQLRGSSSMEFFFLDEGFGTLDSNLLDIVMNSLEKLQDEDLAVGIISHVEELKQRVPIKLMVKPARPGIRGTKVKISRL